MSNMANNQYHRMGREILSEAEAREMQARNMRGPGSRGAVYNEQDEFDRASAAAGGVAGGPAELLPRIPEMSDEELMEHSQSWIAQWNHGEVLPEMEGIVTQFLDAIDAEMDARSNMMQQQMTR
jgi:hypothetical protein